MIASLGYLPSEGVINIRDIPFEKRSCPEHILEYEERQGVDELSNLQEEMIRQSALLDKNQRILTAGLIGYLVSRPEDFFFRNK